MINKISEGRFMLASVAANKDDAGMDAKTCGDTLCACSLPGEKLALILSDGMGKGTEAAAESRIVVDELRKLLKKGVAHQGLLRLLIKNL